MFDRLDKYIIRETMTPFWMTLGVAALLLVLERMLRLFDFVINQGGPVDVVFRMLATLLPHYLGLALPIGMFLGILLAFRKLSLGSELDAIQASGISLARLARPLFILSAVFAAVNVVLMGYIQPLADYTYRNLEFDLRSGALGASIRVGEYAQLGDDMILRVDESQANGRNLVGIFLERTLEDGRKVSISANRGTFFATEDRQTVVLRLFDGSLITQNAQNGRFRTLSFDSQDITLDLPSFSAFRDRGSQYLEMTADELYTQMDNPDVSLENRNMFRANFHWRLSHTLVFFMLPLLAIPMGITSHRASRSWGIAVGLALVILFNELIEVCEVLVATGGFSPYQTYWPLFAIYGLISAWLFSARTWQVGYDPLSWLDRIWSAITAPILRRLRKVVE